MMMKLLLLKLLTTAFASFFSLAEAGSDQWEKVQNGVSLLRDLLVREGHDGNDNAKLHHKGLTLVSGGFPRTGTKSIETALTQLGFKVYDNRAMVEHDHFEEWINVTRYWKENGSLDHMRAMVNKVESLGYTATLDIPMNLLAPALIQVRPDAKGLWNYRAEGVDDWYESLSFITWFAEPLFYARPCQRDAPDREETVKVNRNIDASIEADITRKKLSGIYQFI